MRLIKSIEKVYQDEESAKYMLHRDIKGKNFTTYISFAKIDNQWKINSKGFYYKSMEGNQIIIIKPGYLY